MSNKTSQVLSSHKKHEILHKVIALVGAVLLLILNAALASGVVTQSLAANKRDHMVNSAKDNHMTDSSIRRADAGRNQHMVG